LPALFFLLAFSQSHQPFESFPCLLRNHGVTQTAISVHCERKAHYLLEILSVLKPPLDAQAANPKSLVAKGNGVLVQLSRRFRRDCSRNALLWAAARNQRWPSKHAPVSAAAKVSHRQSYPRSASSFPTRFCAARPNGWHVFQKDKRWFRFFDNSKDLNKKAASLSSQPDTVTRHADVLTREPTVDDVHAPANVTTWKCGDVVPDWGVGQTPIRLPREQYCLTVSVILTVGDWPHPGR
jgi:hypothetical protein